MTEVWDLVEDYARKLALIDYGSGKVKNSNILKPYYDSRENLQEALNHLNANNSHMWPLINDYAHKLQAVDYWSGSVKNSTALTPAYDATKNLKLAISQLAEKNEKDLSHKLKM